MLTPEQLAQRGGGFEGLSRRFWSCKGEAGENLFPGPMGSSSCVGWTRDREAISQTRRRCSTRCTLTGPVIRGPCRRESGEEGLAGGVSWRQLKLKLRQARTRAVDRGSGARAPSARCHPPRSVHVWPKKFPWLSWGAADGDKLAGGGSQGLVPVRRGQVSNMASTSLSHHIDSLEAATPAVV